jgi:hypothetical protein
MILSLVGVTAWIIDGVWIDDRIYCTICYYTSQAKLSPLLHLLRLISPEAPSILPLVKVKVMLDRPFSRPVRLGLSTNLGLKTRFLLLSDSCMLVDVGRSLWREDGSVICQTQSTVISLSVCTIYISHVIKCMYIQHIQGLCQFRHSTADHALPLVAPATTAVYSLERSYAWPPPSLSLLYFLFCGSPCPCLCLRSSWYSLGAASTENTASCCRVLIHCSRDMLTAPMLSNERGANYRKHRSSIVTRVRFRGNVYRAVA